MEDEHTTYEQALGESAQAWLSVNGALWILQSPDRLILSPDEAWHLLEFLNAHTDTLLHATRQQEACPHCHVRPCICVFEEEVS